jgi:hypothetical protein
MLFLLKDNILRAKTKRPFYYQTLLSSYSHRLRCMKDGVTYLDINESLLAIFRRRQPN